MGVIDAHKYVDASTLENEEDIEKAVLNYTIFGRVKPNQKRQIIKVLQSQGHTVAMTGDGVNDVLALKDSDCSIAMASGSDAARRTSQLVLTDSNFKSVPKVVMEGRRVINNIERNASLFLVKTIYSFLLSILFLFIPYNYPFEPIQLTLISALTIGLPSFFFTFETNNNIIKKGFLKNVIKRASIGALTIVFNIVAVLIISYKLKLSKNEISSMAAILTGVVGLMVLLSICVPFTLRRKILVISMSIMFLLAITFFEQLFSIYPVSLIGIFVIILLILIDYPIIKLLHKMTNKVLKFH